MSVHANNSGLLNRLRAAQYDWNESDIRSALNDICAPDAVFRLAHPFGDMKGADAFYDHALAKLQTAWPDLERRDWIVMAGDDQQGAFRVYVNDGDDNAAPTERFGIGQGGEFRLSGANIGSSGQVITSQGSGSPVYWATPASGWVHAAEVSLNGNTAITLTDVPDGASHIRYLIRYMSFSGVAQAKIQLQKSTTGGSKSIITSNYQSFSTYFATSGGSSGGGGNTDSIDIFDAYSATANNLFGSVDIYRIGTNGSDGTNYLIEHQGFANYNGTLSANFMTNAYIELGTSSTDFICGAKFYGNTGESFDNGYINQSYLLS